MVGITFVKDKLGRSSIRRSNERTREKWCTGILVPRAHDPSGLRQGSRALAGSKTGSPWITDFRLFYANSEVWNNSGCQRLQKCTFTATAHISELATISISFPEAAILLVSTKDTNVRCPLRWITVTQALGTRLIWSWNLTQAQSNRNQDFLVPVLDSSGASVARSAG